MLYATTRRGVFVYDSRRDEVAPVIGNGRAGLFARRARGFYGICWHRRSGLLLVASRERLGTPRAGKRTTDVRLHFVEPGSRRHWLAAEVHDVHDVHQIACHEDFVFLTDTGKNRIHVYNLARKRPRAVVNIGPARADINHVNALLVRGDALLVGLSNRGHRDAEILFLPMAPLRAGAAPELDAQALGRVVRVPGVRDSHGLEPWRDQLLLCASPAGRVTRADGTALTRVGAWARGLAPFAGGMWVGTNAFVPRTRRDNMCYDGRLVCLSEKLEILQTARLTGAGLVNDLCWIA